MPLEAGTQLGPYEILSPLGAGGMGEVYKARDTRLDRTVAIKVLLAHVADDPDLRQRFEREAKTISSLNHPHICTLHDIGQQDGIDFLVMEYLEGETLAARLTKGPLPTDQVLRYATEIADALDKAHRKGITHRDLKPGNVMITKAGTKLLDFGLAKLRDPKTAGLSVSQRPTGSASLTGEGTILGTLQYMAPEQLEGREADARTDIFAFGAVLYEMATGRKAFEGKSQASLISAIMTSDPPTIVSLQPMSPPALDQIVKTCLAKDPDDRWQSAGDLGRQLKILQGGPQPGVAVPVIARPQRVGWRRTMPFVATAAVASLVAGMAVWTVTRPDPPAPRPATRFAVALPSTDLLGISGLALSPDGRNLVYMATRDGVEQLYRREMDQLEAVPIRGTEGAQFPFLSPDGASLGFFADGALKKVSLAGGPAVTLCDVPGARLGASWGPDDAIVFASGDAPGLMKVSAAGGVAEPVTTVDADQGEAGHRWLDVLPDGKAVLFTVWSTSLDDARIAVRSMDTGEQRMLVDGTNPRYAPTGHIIFGRDGSLWAVPFDVDALEVTGPITPVLEGVQINGGGLALFTLAGDGSLAYVAAGVQGGRMLTWVDREGQEEPLGAEARTYTDPAVSPDGTRVAVTVLDLENTDVWIWSLAGRTLTRLTFDPGFDLAPLWTPDSARVVFRSLREGGGLFWKAADGTGEVEPLMESPNAYALSWAADGRLVFAELTSGGFDIGVLTVEGEPNRDVLLDSEFSEERPAVSPDGQWLAYESDQSGQAEIYVRPFPNVNDGRWPISTDGGEEPQWGPEGRELFYLAPDNLMVTQIETDPTFSWSTPERVFSTSGYAVPLNAAHRYDIEPDGRFLMLKPTTAETTDGDSSPEVIFVLNWFEELQRLVPTGR